ncbi:MAG: gas vesicle protein GvpK [Thermoguttaceae bacterium]
MGTAGKPCRRASKEPCTSNATTFFSAEPSPTFAPRAHIRLDPDNVRNGLIRLVLTLVELLRELLERQALRRIDGGSLSAEEIERLGLTFLRLSQEMDRLKQEFGLSDEDLNLDLGPLGTLR